MKTKKIAGLIAVLFLFFSFQTAYGWGENYGILKKSLDVNNMFTSHQVRPDHRYYYSGPDDFPNAIIGIHNDYSLESRLWKPVDLTPAKLKKWLGNMLRNQDQPWTNWGAYILDPNGKKIGIWFSRFDITTIKMLDDTRVQVYTPNLGDGSMTKSGLGGI